MSEDGNATIQLSGPHELYYERARPGSRLTARSADELINRTPELWQSAIDTMLAWRNEPDEDPESPSAECLETAMDLAVDFRSNLSAPTSLAWSGDGGLAFEWSAGDEIVTYEVVGSGVVEYTRFKSGRAIESFMLKRSPRTRRLEIQSQGSV